MEPGNVIIQTYDPENYSIQTAANQDYESFYHQEIRFRRRMASQSAGCAKVMAVSAEETGQSVDLACPVVDNKKIL